MKLKPMGDKVIIKQAEAEETTKSGLFIPDTAQEKPLKGTVVAVGEGAYDEHGKNRIPMDVKAGDVVMYRKYGGTEVKVDDVEYVVLSASEIIAIILD
jgi:chaperonin GroES